MIVNQYGTYKEHGHRHTRLYNIWSGIKARCNRRNNPDYKLYGARGIKVCDEWNDFIAFYAWAIANGYGETLTIVSTQTAITRRVIAGGSTGRLRRTTNGTIT